MSLPIYLPRLSFFKLTPQGKSSGALESPELMSCVPISTIKSPHVSETFPLGQGIGRSTQVGGNPGEAALSWDYKYVEALSPGLGVQLAQHPPPARVLRLPLLLFLMVRQKPLLQRETQERPFSSSLAFIDSECLPSL